MLSVLGRNKFILIKNFVRGIRVRFKKVRDSFLVGCFFGVLKMCVIFVLGLNFDRGLIGRRGGRVVFLGVLGRFKLIWFRDCKNEFFWK